MTLCGVSCDLANRRVRKTAFHRQMRRGVWGRYLGRVWVFVVAVGMGLCGAFGFGGIAEAGTKESAVQGKNGTESERLLREADAFVVDLSRHFPTEATEMGIHTHDGELDDWSQAGVDRTLAWLSEVEERLRSFSEKGLRPAEAFDLSVLRHEVGRRKFLLGELPAHKQKPAAYLGLLSRSTNGLLKRDFAPKAERMQKVIARLHKGARLLSVARGQLTEMSQASVDVALRTLPETIGFFQNDVVEAFADVGGSAGSAQQAELRKASQEMVAALADFGRFLRTEGKAKAVRPFALGETLFERALLKEEGIEEKVADLLPSAEAELSRLRAEFDKTAALIDPNRSAEEVQASVAQNHPKRHELIDYTASRQAAQAAFLVEHDIVTMPKDVLPRVRETPPFMRATTLASMDTPGPYEKATEAYYYVTLPDPSWPVAEAEDFLRGAHNRPLIDVVTIHEAFPGHYVQYLWLAKLSKARQVVESIANEEGWAHYAEEMMMEAGYATGKPQVRLMQLQDALLRGARFVAGLKMHCKGMTQAQAEVFFHKEGRQMRAVAEVEARRGTQDPMFVLYTYGKLEILKLRRDYEACFGKSTSLRKFHDLFLSHGRAPLSMIRQAMLGKSGDKSFGKSCWKRDRGS